MITAVYDSNVIISGLLWRGESYLCLVAQARRRVRVVASAWILEEVSRSLKEIASKKSGPGDPWPGFNWFSDTARMVVPGPTGKRRSRDPKDEPILGTALAARVKLIVTKDRDLLDLGQPFGIQIFHPRQFLTALKH